MSKFRQVALISVFLLTLSIVSMAILDISDLSGENIVNGTFLGHLIGTLVVFGAVGGLAYLIFGRSHVAFYIGATIAAIGSTVPALNEGAEPSTIKSPPSGTTTTRSTLSGEDAQIDEWVRAEGLDTVMAKVISEGQKNLPIVLNNLDTITTITYLPSRDVQIYNHVVPGNWKQSAPETPSLSDSERKQAIMASLKQYGLNAACTNSTMKLLMDHGLRITHVYHEESGRELMQLTISREQCDAP